MEGDLIFVNIDPVFNIALEALKELEDEERLEVINQQKASLSAIQSNVEGEDNIFKFGRGTWKENQAFQFGKTASAVFRMVMLCAVGIEEKFWPNLGPNLGPNTKKPRNKEVLQFNNELPVEPGQGPNSFMLLEGVNANEKTVLARKYCVKYDHVFPDFHISGKVLENEGKNVNFRNTMLIFRNSFTEVVIIKTNANATMYPSSDLDWGRDSERDSERDGERDSKRDSEFDSDVTVTCTRKKISKGKGVDKYFQKLKKWSSRAGQEQPQRMARKRSEVVDQLKKDKGPDEVEEIRSE